MKVTGRYPIYNLPYLVSKASQFILSGGVFWGDIKDHRIFEILHLPYSGKNACAVMYAATTDGYMDSIGSKYEQLHDQKYRWVEHLIYEYLKREDKNPLVSCRFPRELNCGGVEGSLAARTGLPIKHKSFRSTMKRCLGNVVRLTLPKLYF